jgi:hypothetical protein
MQRHEKGRARVSWHDHAPLTLVLAKCIDCARLTLELREVWLHLRLCKTDSAVCYAIVKFGDAKAIAEVMKILANGSVDVTGRGCVKTQSGMVRSGTLFFPMCDCNISFSRVQPRAGY